MSNDKISETRAQLHTAPYDNLGWVRAAFERSLDLVRHRLMPKYAHAAAKTALAYAKTWHADSTPSTDKYFEYAMMGLTPTLFVEHPRVVLERLVSVGDWTDMNVMVQVTPVDDVRALLDSSELSAGKYDYRPSEPQKSQVPLDMVLALYAVQTLIPSVGHMSPAYFDLSITAIKGWMIRETEASSHYGTCNITGKDTSVRAYTKDGLTMDISKAGLRQVKGYKPERTLTTHAVKQIGLPVLAFCPVCITRRSVRSEHEEENTPAFPMPTRYIEENEAILAIGNPINTGQRVLTGAYLKMWPGKGNVLQKQIRRQCPACMSLAIKQPEVYCAYITEMNSNKGKGPVTPKLHKEWLSEFTNKDGNELRYQNGRETEMFTSGETDAEEVQAPRGMTISTQEKSILDVAAAFQQEQPNLLDNFVDFKMKKNKLRARLKKDVSLDVLEEVLDMYGAFDEPVTINHPVEEEE